MKVVEYWRGTIKNYRYDEEVSTPQNRKDKGLVQALKAQDSTFYF